MIAKVNFFIATAGAVSPWWLPTVSNVSQAAAALLPIVSVVWIVIQIFGFFAKRRKP